MKALLPVMALCTAASSVTATPVIGTGSTHSAVTPISSGVSLIEASGKGNKVNPFTQGDATEDDAEAQEAPSVVPEEEVTNEENPFSNNFDSDHPENGRVGDCGPNSSLARAELRKPELAQALCQRRYKDIDSEWLFAVYYVTGFNEFLEERGAFMDPTGACSRAVEPRQSLNLIYEAIDFLLGKGSSVENDARYEKMLEPFVEDWRMIPFVLMELNASKREGRLDATSVASRGMCGDPKFKLFWGNAIDYVKRVPGTGE